jgi:phage terminase small subunit
MNSAAYSEILVLAARALAAVEHYDSLIKLHGNVYKSPKGLLKKNPAVDLYHQAMRDARLYLLEFGLSPREINRVNVIPGNENQGSLFGMFRGA